MLQQHLEKQAVMHMLIVLMVLLKVIHPQLVLMHAVIQIRVERFGLVVNVVLEFVHVGESIRMAQSVLASQAKVNKESSIHILFWLVFLCCL